eukprot:m51a1_g12759 hypothetical protein (671) ;mRNA; r:826-3464
MCKNVALQRSQGGATACLAFAPVLAIVLTGILQHAIEGTFPNRDGLVDYDAFQVLPYQNTTSWPSRAGALCLLDRTDDRALGWLSPVPYDCGGNSSWGLVESIPRSPQCALVGSALNITADPRAPLAAEKRFRLHMTLGEFLAYRGDPNGTTAHDMPLAVLSATNVLRGNEKRVSVDIAVEEQGFMEWWRAVTAMAPLVRASLRAPMLSSALRAMGHNYTLHEFAKVMPYVAHTEGTEEDVGSFIFAFLTAFVLSSLVPVTVNTIVQEKQQHLMGMSTHAYWASHFVFSLVVYTVVVAEYVSVGLCFRIRSFTQTAWELQLALYSGWGVNQVALSFLLSSAFDRTRTASIACYVFVTLCCISSFVFSLALWPIDQDKRAHWLTLMFPPWAAYRAFATIGLRCWVFQRATRCPAYIEGELVTLLVRDLRKVYDNGTVALDHVSLHADKDQCLGLLGPNGAGKSTLLSVLTGATLASSGSASICGFDVQTSVGAAHRVVGVCPQFDCVWPDLSPYETLLFYSRIRGLWGADAHESAMQLLASVGLELHRDKRVRELSGGMRRRLSIAIALVGDPRVVFLDEPTTGLDVVTRRQLWDVLLRAQRGRTTVLTTHSMEEAEALCNRIAVVAEGRLQAIGTSLHLKERFGSGYTLLISFHPDDEARATEYTWQQHS